jgi:hypothetical protein
MDFTQFGGVPAPAPASYLMTGRPDGWNFGVVGKPGLMYGAPVPSTAPFLYDVAPHLMGRWDGKTTICPHDAARKVLGKDMPAQMQPRGTCGGRAAKMGLQLLQTLLIANGRRAKYHPVSHAFPYAVAREEGGILGPEDGVLDGSIPPVMAKGNVTMAEAGETGDYGAGSDDLAAKWGRTGAPAAVKALAADNPIGADFARVRTFQEYADGCAAGGIGVVSDDDGYTMTRDKDGVCKRVREPWYHYHLFDGLAVLPSGRVVVPYDQSWGANVPAGPKLMDGRWPDYCFGVDRADAEETLRNNTVHLIFGFQLWDESAVPDVSWADMMRY